MLRRRILPKAKGARGVAPWIHIEDAVNAGLAAMECGPAGEIYNIVDDEPVGMNEWLTHAALTLKAKPPFLIPLWLLRLISPYLATVFGTRLAHGPDERASHDGHGESLEGVRRRWC